jgi:hypothetical protein
MPSAVPGLLDKKGLGKKMASFIYSLFFLSNKVWYWVQLNCGEKLQVKKNKIMLFSFFPKLKK